MSQSQSPTRTRAAVRRPRPTTARAPGYGVVGSVVFHGLILAATFFTLHANFKTPDETHVVPVDLVTIADKTNVAAQAPPPEKMEMPKPSEVQPLEPHLQTAEPAPVPPVPKFKVEEEKKVEDDDNKPKTKKEQQKDFASLLDKLTTPDKPVKNAKPGPRPIQRQGLGNAMTADLVSALQSQIYRCWSPPTGVPNPNDLVVDFEVTLNPDGTVQRATSPSTRANNPNSYNLAAGLAAQSAIFRCAPYHLPQNRYEEWRDIAMRFDPRQMEQ